VAALLAGAGSGLTALHLLPPVYRAEALVLIEPRGSRVAAEGAATSVLDLEGSAVDSQVEVLSSPGLVSRVVDKLSMDQPEAAPPDRAAMVEELLGRLEVVRQGKTRVIAVRVRDRDPVRAAQIANLLVEAWLVDQLAGKYTLVTRTTGWFGDKLRALGQQVAAAEARVVAFREEHAQVLDVALARVDDRLADLEREHLLALAARRALEARVTALRQRAADSTIGTAALGAVTPLLSALEAAQADLVRREAELRGLYGEKHPLVADLLREKVELTRRIESERQAILARFEADLTEARERERTLAAELERIRGIAAQARRAELEKRRLEREAELDRRLYESFASRLQATSDAEAVEQPDARIIAEATPPMAPIFPQARIILPIGIITGLGLGLIGLYLRERLDRSLATTRDISRELGLATLALVPELRRRRGVPAPHDYVLEHPRSRLAEALRELLARIVTEPGGSSGRVLLVASALPGEGKSTLTLALGRMASREGLKVLLVDADLRKPGLAAMAGVAAGAGFAELLEGRLALADVLRRDSSGLELVPGSSRHLRPAPLLAGDRLRTLFAALRSAYDLVLVDSAPLAAVADTQLLAPEADGILFVVRWRHVAAPVAQDALGTLGAARDRVLGAVLCRVAAPAYARYGDAASDRLARRLAAYYVD
jgi:capsular exopolysaccharide synthesis family protein